MLCTQRNPRIVTFATICSWIGAVVLTVFGSMCVLAVIMETFPSIVTL